MNAVLQCQAPPAQHVSASLNYLGNMCDKPYFYVHQRMNDHLQLVSRTVKITDARGRQPSLDVEGFCLVAHRASVRLESKRAVLCAYGAEMERLIRDLTGAEQVSAASMGVLRVVESSSQTTTVHRPVRFVHADCTDEAALQQLHRRFAGGAQLPSGRRCAIYHVWRSPTPAPRNVPLALCDARSVQAQDCVAADTILDFPGSRPGRTESTLFHYHPDQQWYYFPDMTSDEVIVFKDFDSDGRFPCRVPHTAFEDPTCPAGVPARVSLDLQLFAIF